MKILKINIPKTFPYEDGLEDIKMERLGAIVLITGKNGSGKTRILNKIFNTLNSKPTIDRLVQIDNELHTHMADLNHFEQRVLEYTEELSKEETQNKRQQINRNIDTYSESIKGKKSVIEKLEKEKNWSYIETDVPSQNYSFVRFVPKTLNLHDSNDFAKHQIISYASSIDSVGIDNLPMGTFAKIQVIQDRWFNATHQITQITIEEKSKAIEEYQKLISLIDTFLGAKIARTINGDATIFGFPLGQSNLSDGQKVLLQFCLAIFTQQVALQNLILVLDEPENHLHPSIIVETIEKIKNCVTDGQIWIATHSIPLLAHFDPSLIWFVENNNIRHAGKIPELVLRSLLGDESEIGKLQDFISLPSQYATSRYAFECLFEPAVVTTGSNDPQSSQIKKSLSNISKSGNLRVLDYGAGKGRLISNIVDLDAKSSENLLNNIDYIAYDKFPDDKNLCEEAIIKAYGTCERKYFNDYDNLISNYDKGSFDVVIMCNVLHEIDPKDWLNLFCKDGTISGLLSTDGILLLVEDNQIPNGEMAYQKGFLVLDTPHLKNLFKISEHETKFQFFDQKMDGRLKAHHIPKNCLIQIDEATRLEALRSLSKTAKQKILDIRTKEKSYSNGKIHGFWTQQFANSQLAISELSTQSDL